MKNNQTLTTEKINTIIVGKLAHSSISIHNSFFFSTFNISKIKFSITVSRLTSSNDKSFFSFNLLSSWITIPLLTNSFMALPNLGFII